MKLKLVFITIILFLITSCEKNNEQTYSFHLDRYHEVMLGDTLKLLIDNQENYHIYTDNNDTIVDFYKQNGFAYFIGEKEGNAKFYAIKSSTERDTMLIKVIPPYFILNFESLDEINNLGLQKVPNPSFLIVTNTKQDCYVLGSINSMFSYVDTPFYRGTYSISLDEKSISMNLTDDSDSLKYTFQLCSKQMIDFLKDMSNIKDKPCCSYSVKMKEVTTNKEVNHATFRFKYDKIPYGLIQ